MFAIYKRELKSYFHSFIGFLFIAVTLFFLGLYFTVYGLLNGYPYFSSVVSSVAFLFLVTVPILTMRVLAEERRSRTDQLTLTAPVSVVKIVMGKYLALLTIFAIPIAILCFYPIILTQFGTVPLAEAYLSIFAYFLYGMAAIAIGLFISSVTESQVIAAVLGFAVLFVGYLMGSICSLISTTGNLVTQILGCFDLHTHFNEMLMGTLNMQGVVYYISLTFLALFLTVQSIQKRRYSMSVKHLSVGAYSTGMIALTVAIMVVLNIMVGELPGAWINIDVTFDKMYSITDQSKEYVASMQEDVTIYVLQSEDNQDATLQQTLQRFDDLSDHITVENVDPVLNPLFHTQYIQESITANSLIVVSEKRNKVIDYNSIYETSVDPSTYATTVTGYDGEGQITSALAYVLSDDMPKVYITEGHGEYTFSNMFLTGLTKENVEYASLNLLEHDMVPEDAACLVINAPVNDFSVDDKDKVIDYLEKGGKVIAITGFSVDTELTNFKAILNYMGLQLADGLVVEGKTDNYYQSPYYLLPTLSPANYTTGLYGSAYVFAPFSQGILMEDWAAEGMSYNIFMATSKEAFAKKDIANMEDVTKAEGDQEGPFAIGVEALKKLENGTATLVVYSCDQLFTDEASSMVGGTNLTLFTNTVSNFVDNEVSSSVPVKSYELSYLTIPQNSVLMWGAIVLLILPLGFLVVGFVVWFRRRKF